MPELVQAPELSDGKLRVSIRQSRRYKREELVQKVNEARTRMERWQARLDRYDELDK